MGEGNAKRLLLNRDTRVVMHDETTKKVQDLKIGNLLKFIKQQNKDS